MSDEIPKMGVEYLNRVEPWGSKPKEGNYEDGYIVNCEITPRAGETPFSHVGGRVRVYLDGYSIKPKEDNGWISVDDRLPKEAGHVLAFMGVDWVECVNVYICPEYGNLIWETISEDDEISSDLVSHWQPIPLPPMLKDQAS